MFHKYLSKASVSQWKRPKTKVRSCVRNCTKDELDGLNHLMDECFSKWVSMGLGAHALDLIFKWLNLIFSLLNQVFGTTTTTYSTAVLDLRINVWEFLIIMNCTLNKLNLWCWGSSEAAWFHKKHDWDANKDSNEESKTNPHHAF